MDTVAIGTISNGCFVHLEASLWDVLDYFWVPRRGGERAKVSAAHNSKTFLNIETKLKD